MLVASHEVTDVSFSVEQTSEVVVVPVPVVVAVVLVVVAVVSVVAAVVSVVVAVVSVTVVESVVSEVDASVAVEPSVVVVSRLPRRPSISSKRCTSILNYVSCCLPALLYRRGRYVC